MASSGGASDKAMDVSGLGSALPGLTAADRAGLVNILKDKLQVLAGREVNVLESLSPDVKKRVAALQQIQRFEIINGIIEVEGVTGELNGNNKTAAKGIPEFWLNAMKMNETLAVQISERDEDALKYLKDIKSMRLEEPKGFKLEFYFDANPYFKNSVLTKMYHMIEDDNEPILERAIGTTIEWHPGKNLTQKLMRKKPKKGPKNMKPITKIEPCESFFNFFNPPQVPENEEEIDQDTAEQLQDSLEQDYEIGTTIRDKIIPHAVSWFTGEAIQGEDYGNGYSESTEDEDDEEEYDDDDENDEDDMDRRKG